MVEDTKKEVIAKVLALENRVNGKYQYAFEIDELYVKSKRGKSYEQPKNSPNSQIYHDVCRNKIFFKILNTDVTQMSQTLEGQS